VFFSSSTVKCFLPPFHTLIFGSSWGVSRNWQWLNYLELC
jgi:hypothetical protein